jgi:hypothetical protein
MKNELRKAIFIAAKIDPATLKKPNLRRFQAQIVGDFWRG